MIKSIIDTQGYYENNNEETLIITSAKSVIDEEEIKNGIDGVTLPSLKDNVINVQ